MSFQLTSKNITLVDGHILSAKCQAADGHWQDASLDLDQFLGNEDGSFDFEGVNFSETAQNARIQADQANVSIVARLQRRDGSWADAPAVNLSERIENQNGELVLLY
ncbi:hypothetical protein BGX34_001763 [Mortierella sp. NVP85]|nr:hypothetical protein BGX34_001763 [Mortierella sp. NVP85]